MNVRDMKLNSYATPSTGLECIIIHRDSFGDIEVLCFDYRLNKYVRTAYRKQYNIYRYNNLVYCNEYGDIIIKQKKKEKQMKNVNYIGGDYKIAVCTFEVYGDDIGKTYNYKVDIDLALESGDFVAVESSTNMGVCKVVNLLDNNMDNAAEVDKATAWVMDKIDMSRHNEKRKATERVKYITRRLEEKKDQIKTIEMYSKLAEFDSETAKLVNEMKQLTGLGTDK